MLCPSRVIVSTQSCTTGDCPKSSKKFTSESRNSKSTSCRVTEKGFVVGIRIRIRNPEPIYMSSTLISTVLFRIRNFKTRNK